MSLRLLLSITLVLCVASIGFAAPIISVSPPIPNFDGTGLDAYEFFYNNDDGAAEFTNWRLIVETTNGAHIHDPDQDTLGVGSEGVAGDTGASSLAGSLGFANSSINFNSYDPTGFTPDDSPTSLLDWSIFDTFGGDSINNIPSPAPFLLARVLIDPAAEGTISGQVFDNQGGGVGRPFEAVILGPDTGIPEPTSVVLLSLAFLGLAGLRRRS